MEDRHGFDIDDRPGFHLGGAHANYVDVRVTGAPSDEWVPALVRLRVGSFLASYPALFQPRDFARLLGGLRRISRSLQGEAALVPEERQLVLEVTGDGRGGVQVWGEAGDVHGDNRLVFSMEPIDQTYLAPAIDGLRDLLRRLGPHAGSGLALRQNGRPGSFEGERRRPEAPAASPAT